MKENAKKIACFHLLFMKEERNGTDDINALASPTSEEVDFTWNYYNCTNEIACDHKVPPGEIRPSSCPIEMPKQNGGDPKPVSKLIY